MSESIAQLLVAEPETEIASEWINPNAFHRFGVAMHRIELTAALGVAQILPVGGFVAGSGEARFLQLIQGRIRKRALLTMRCKLRRRCSLVQPMAASRGLVFQALAPKPST